MSDPRSNAFHQNSLERRARRFHRAHTPAARPSLNQITTLRQPLDEDVVSCRDAGISGIGLWRPKLAEFGEERAAELLNDSRMRVTSLSWAGGFTGPNGYSFDDAVKDARDALRLAAAIDARCLAIVGGPRLKHTARHARRLIVDGLRELVDEADELHVDLALQPMHRVFAHDWTFLNSLDDALDVLQRCAHPRVKLALDTYQLAWDARFLTRLPECVPHVAIVQLSDGHQRPRSQTPERCPLGEGSLPLTQIVQTLLSSGYCGEFEIAVWSAKHWAAEDPSLLTNCMQQFESLCRG